MNNDHNHSQSINSINFYFKNILKNIQDDINSHIDIDHIISKEEQNQYQNQMELDYWNVFFNGINREKNDEKISKDMITDIKNIIDKWKYDIVPWLQIEEIIVDYISESPCYQLKIDEALYRIDNFVNEKAVSIEEKESRIVFITVLLKNCAMYACHDGYLPLFTLLQSDTIQSVLKQNQSLLLSSLDSPIFMKMLLLCSIIDFVDIFKLIFVIGFGNGNPHLYCGILDSFEIKDLLNVLCWDFYCLFTTKKDDEWKSILKEALNFDDNFIRVNDCKVISGLQWKDNVLETFPHNFGPISPVKKSDIFPGKESKNINTNSQSDPIFFNSKAIEIRLILDPNIPIKAVNAYNIFLSLLNDRLSRKSLLLASKEMSEMIYGKHSRFGGKVGYMLENDDVDMFMDFFNCQKIINRSWNEYQVTNTLFEDCWIDPNLIKISREFPGERMHLNEMVLASGSIKILKYMILQNFMISKLFSTNLLSFSAISPNNKYCEIVHLVENYIPDISTWHDTDEEENLLLSIIKRLDNYNPDKVNQVEPLDVCMSVKTRRKNLMEYWIDLIDMHNVESQEMVQKYNMLYHAFIGALGVCNISVIDYLLGIISDEIEKYFSNHQKETTDNYYDENLIMFWLIMYLVSCDIYFPENKFFMIHPIRTMFMKLGINCNYKTPNKHTIFSSSISSGLLPLFSFAVNIQNLLMKWQSKSSIIKYLAMLPVHSLMSHPYYSPSLLTSIFTSQPTPVQTFSSHSNLFSFFPKSLTTTSSISTFRLSPEMLVNLLHNNQNSTSRQVQYKILNKAMQLNIIDRSGKENEFRVEMPFPMSPQKRHQIDSWNIRGEWNDYGNEVFITWNIVNENCNRKKIPINDFDLLFDFGMLKQTIRVFISKIEAMTPFLNKRKNIFNKEHTIRIKMIRFPSDSQFIAKFEGKIKSNFMDFILLKGNLFPLSKLEKYCEITTVSKMNHICMQYNVSITHFHVIEEENTNDYNKIVVLTLRISEPFVSSISNDSSESLEELRSMAIFWVRNPLYIAARLD